MTAVLCVFGHARVCVFRVLAVYFWHALCAASVQRGGRGRLGQPGHKGAWVCDCSCVSTSVCGSSLVYCTTMGSGVCMPRAFTMADLVLFYFRCSRCLLLAGWTAETCVWIIIQWSFSSRCAVRPVPACYLAVFGLECFVSRNNALQILVLVFLTRPCTAFVVL